MTAKANLAKGFDTEYAWRQVGGAEPGKDAASYYMSAAEGGGEPPGRWYGPGAEVLGFEAGQRVERQPYDDLYKYRRDPRDSATPLGRGHGKAAAADQRAESIYQELFKAEPHATADRQRELRNLAARQARQSPLYFDLTVSFSKSISIFHASLGENARQARAAGDAGGEARWSGLLTETDELLYDAVHAGFDYFQREAGYTRTGHHGGPKDAPAGEWHEAALAVVHWLQHTSRDGDMQLHVHSQIAHVAQTVLDGKWRAPDSMGYNEFIGGVASVVATHFESAMTRRFGLEWIPREDGYGYEIAGIGADMMKAFSSRRESIKDKTAQYVADYEAATGRKPSQQTVAQLAQRANLATRRHKGDESLDFDQYHAAWDARSKAEFGVSLASIAPRVWGLGPGDANPTQDSHAGPTALEVTQAAQLALDVTQAQRSAWTKADLIKNLGMVLPASARSLPPAEATALLEVIAEDALAGRYQPVSCLEAPRAVEPPASLIRADGRSIYQRHGGTRYATNVQIGTERGLLSHAGQETAPVLSREDAAALMGAGPDQLDAALRARAQDDRAEGDLSSGLRLDQAAALYHVLTSPRTAEVIVGPAGSGKTRALAAAAKAWQQSTGGEVIGTATAQAARNNLADAGVRVSANTSVLLGHSKTAREARPSWFKDLAPGALILIDEASMMSMADMESIVRQAAEGGHKVIISGDNEQLTAVEGGGAMMLVARRNGSVQLAEPVRFIAEWEREASLRLRAGDLSALENYDEQGRIFGGPPDENMDEAAKAYVAGYLEGRDVLLMAKERDTCRELSRRIRDDLIHYGHVDAGPEVTLAEGAKASVGDFIICRDNDHGTEAGQRGRTLANGDVLRIEAIKEDGAIIVRRALDADRETGERRWTSKGFRYTDYRKADLAYAVTGHSAQGRTVNAGIAVLNGTEDRQWAYVALTRGTDSNTAYVATVGTKVADPKAGTRAAPEIERRERTERERAGLPPEPVKHDPTNPAAREKIAVLSDILQRDGSEESALETQSRNLSNADHLGILNAQWAGQTEAARTEHFRGVVRAALPPGHEAEDLDGHTAKWLWRTMKLADAAGLDVAEVTSRAVSSSSLAGARDVAAVIDARIRSNIGSVVPLPARPWSQQVPDIADTQTRDYVTRLAAMMDNRVIRIGEHIADYPPAWAVRALGEVPEAEADRADWTQRAAAVGAYRELYGYDHPTEAIGPEPTSDTPEKRAAWHGGLAALGPVDGLDVRGLPDGGLIGLRRSYASSTAWAPRYVADELRDVRAGAESARQMAIRSAAEVETARKEGDEDRAARHEVLAGSARSMAAGYAGMEPELAATMESRQAWEQATEDDRRNAVAADAELRRRHPERAIDPLVSAEPEAVTEAEREELLAAVKGTGEQPAWVQDLAAMRRRAEDRIAERATVRLPAEDPELGDGEAAWPSLISRERDAVLQPPKPDIEPAGEVTARADNYEAGR